MCLMMCLPTCLHVSTLYDRGADSPHDPVLAPNTKSASGAPRLGSGTLKRAVRMNHGSIDQGGTMRWGRVKRATPAQAIATHGVVDVDALDVTTRKAGGN
jgi:hypothetical protein